MAPMLTAFVGRRSFAQRRMTGREDDVRLEERDDVCGRLWMTNTTSVRHPESGVRRLKDLLKVLMHIGLITIPSSVGDPLRSEG